MKHPMKLPAALLLAALMATTVPVKANAAAADELLARALPDLGALENANVTAREVSVVFEEHNPISQLLKPGSPLSESDRNQLASVAAKVSSAITTNGRSHRYQFGRHETLITSFVTNQQSGQIAERILVTPGAVFTSRTFQGEAGNSNTVFGEVSARQPNAVVGWPCFLSKATLRQWASSALRVAHATGTSSKGENCDVLTLTIATEGPVKTYRLFLRTSDASPVELRSFLPDGKLYSSSELVFAEGKNLGMCQRAMTRIFTGEAVFKQSTWEITGVKEDESVLIASLDSFFPVGTHVSDRRFAKPIDYTYGTRPPNDEEVREMLRSPRGRVRYERDTHSEAQVAGARAMQSLAREKTRGRAALIRLIVGAAILTPLAVWCVRLRAGKIRQRHPDECS